MDKSDISVAVEVSELVNLAQEIMTERDNLNVKVSQFERDNADAILNIMRVPQQVERYLKQLLR